MMRLYLACSDPQFFDRRATQWNRWCQSPNKAKRPRPERKRHRDHLFQAANRTEEVVKVMAPQPTQKKLSSEEQNKKCEDEAHIKGQNVTIKQEASNAA